MFLNFFCSKNIIWTKRRENLSPGRLRTTKTNALVIHNRKVYLELQRLKFQILAYLCNWAGWYWARFIRNSKSRFYRIEYMGMHCMHMSAKWHCLGVLYQEFKISILSLSLLSRGFGVNSEICRLSKLLDSVDPDLVCIMRRPIGQSLHCS